MATNWKQLYALKKQYGEIIKKIAPQMENRAGIYIWYRPKYCFYAGQSVKLLDRSIQHLMQHDHLGLSIRKHGLYDKVNNPDGWRLRYYYCDEKDLNEEERKAIAKLSEDNIPYNITSGGQDSGKYDINQRAASKGYRDGIKAGISKCQKYIKNIFDKYLTYKMKEPYLTKKGDIQSIKKEKLEEFTKFLNGELKL